jgi:hypothetical protein
VALNSTNRWKHKNSLRINQLNEGQLIKSGIQTYSDKRELNSSDVPSAPHTVQHPTDALSGIGTIYEAK